MIFIIKFWLSRICNKGFSSFQTFLLGRSGIYTVLKTKNWEEILNQARLPDGQVQDDNDLQWFIPPIQIYDQQNL